MAYDDMLAGQYRDWLRSHEGITEKQMMGGVCFFANGNMIGGADRTKDGVGRFMFRIGKENQALGESLPGASPMVQGGRAMDGFFFVAEDACSADELKIWFNHALRNARSLPPK